MKRETNIILAVTAATVFLAVAATTFYAVFFTTPHMRIQQSIRAFEAAMPLAPAASVPLAEGGRPADPATPPVPVLAATPENLAAGAVYYRYYCAFCHGDSGDGQGPVGDSYMPRPAGLNGPRLQELSDQEMLRAILAGPGHEPVLTRVVPPQAYPYLILAVRAMNGQTARQGSMQ